MTSAERFEQIENNLLVVTQTLKSLGDSQAALAETQTRTDKALGNLQTSQAGLLASQANLQAMLATLIQSVNQHVEAADARMKHTEAALDNLIRTIAAEHGNGKH